MYLRRKQFPVFLITTLNLYSIQDYMFRPIMTGHVQVGLHTKFCQGYCHFSTVKIITLKNLDSLWIKPTDALNSNFIGITTLHVSGSLSAHRQEFLAVHRLWYILCSCDRLVPGVGWNSSYSVLLLVTNGHKCIKCTKADVRLRIPDDGQKGCPKHVES